MKLLESKYAFAYRQEMEKRFSESEVNALWEKAESRFQKLLTENPEQPKAVIRHTYISIFPAIAIYKAMETEYPGRGMEILEHGAAAVSKKAGAKYAKILKIPGIKGIFMRVFSRGVKKGFGVEAGFSHEFITDSGSELAFNVTKCPYQDYCEKYGCSEIVPVFCKNDEYAYGNLPGIQFIRTQTLGTGGSCCDFRLER